MRTTDQIRDASIARFCQLAGMKFDAGQAEHGGDLDKTVTFGHIEEECIDLWHYLQSLKRQIAALERENSQMLELINAEDRGGWPKGGEVD